MMKISDTRDCTCFNLRRASRNAAQIYDRHLKSCGLNNTQFTLLSAVSMLGPISITELAQQLGTERTTLTRNLKLVVNEGYIVTLPGNDERSRHIKITSQGKLKLTEALPHWKKAQTLMINTLGEENWTLIMESLRNFETAMSSLK